MEQLLKGRSVNNLKYWETCNLIICRKQDEYYKAMAREFLIHAKKCIKDKDCFLAVMGGGRSPKRINEEIVKADEEYGLDWSKVYIFLSDERCVEKTSNHSNYKLITETLMNKVGGNPLYSIYELNYSKETSASLYHDYIKKMLVQTGQDYFDYALLGVGEDGHTASLFPGRLPKNTDGRFAVCSGKGTEGLERISLSVEALNRCSLVSFIVNSVGKIKVLDSMKETWNAERYPMQNIVSPKNMHILQEE